VGFSGSRVSVLDFNKSTQPFTAATQVVTVRDYFFFFFLFQGNHVLNSGNCCFSLHILSTKMFSKQEITMDALPVLFSVAASDYEQFVVFIHLSYISVSV